MRVGVISVYVDYNRKGEHHRGILQPQIGPLVAALLPPDVDVDVISDTWDEPDWSRDYDLLFISSLHSDFDRARQVSHYWRRRGARTVFGGVLASTYPDLCRPFFDALVIGDAEGAVGRVYRDFCRGELQPVYLSSPYDATQVPVPRFDLLAGRQVLPLSLEATRGCPFACDFCALTGIGTRHHVRPVELVLHDIRQGQEQLRGLVPDYKRVVVAFVDNNLGGNVRYLSLLCEQLAPLRLRWGAAVTFNCIADPQIVNAMAKAGCRFLFVGLESFNQAAIADMRKYQNLIDQTRRALDCCRNAGILVLSGLMLSPAVDDWQYVQEVPQRLAESGLHVPTFISFECPIPGTPQFHRLASQPAAFMPGALLRDFAGYVLVEKPQRATVSEFVSHYQWVLGATYRTRNKLRKLADDLPRFLSGGHWDTAMVDAIHQCGVVYRPPHPERTYIAGADVPPPEMASVPLGEADFDSEEAFRSVMEPWRVTDERGTVLPAWRRSVSVFTRRGDLTPDVQQLVGLSA